MPYKHGHKSGYTETGAYTSWRAMRQRVKTNKWYTNISVDPKWESFEIFLEEMGERPDGCTLERIDNSLGYSKENCRWATMKEQGANKRNNWLLDGEAFVSLCDKNGVKYSAARARVRRGWSMADACSTPVRKMKPKAEWGVLTGA